ncbi:CBS domain-containing protein [Pseudooceanicola algae]|uniref:CBS domain-containing protein n=1 Tax=Pseudooceanicola algae TaxID=1537215 RepID=A0A418SD30_9RHOB|nr:CBS domain-containing protein [Pseudooceanicola algae]QPM92300.1 hypothetical protein PSAL_035640 [Pseudooceanicola algae]
MTRVPITPLIRTQYLTLAPETPIRRATALLVESREAVAPVLHDDGQMVGLLTQKDCFRSALHASYYREWTGNVSDHMSRTVVFADANDDLIKLAEMFLAYPHRILPVCDAEQLVGLVHRSDILTELVRLG